MANDQEKGAAHFELKAGKNINWNLGLSQAQVDDKLAERLGCELFGCVESIGQY